MKKIVTILGARPQFIKAAVVSRNISESQSIKEIIVHTGQHFDTNMSDIFFDEMEIPKPNYNLNINGLDHGAMTGQMLEKIEEVLKIEKPDCVLVYGDTNSTLAGALAAKKLHIKVAHIEAGLRSFNIKMPEEVNRILTDRISDILFCPTESAILNLQKEGYENIDCKILNSGDVMYDASLFYEAKSKKPNYEIPDQFVLCTIHRGENTDNPEILGRIIEGLIKISSSISVVIPLHPRTRKKLIDLNYDFEKSNIIFIDPVGYFEMIYLISNSKLIITDSGGLQKEAYFFKKHCLVIREETEWVELVDNGFNFICGSNPDKLSLEFNKAIGLLGSNFETQLYGDGDAGKHIVVELEKFLS